LPSYRTATYHIAYTTQSSITDIQRQSDTQWRRQRERERERQRSKYNVSGQHDRTDTPVTSSSHVSRQHLLQNHLDHDKHRRSSRAISQ